MSNPDSARRNLLASLAGLPFALVRGGRPARGAEAAGAAGPRPWHHLPDGTFRNPPGSPAQGGSAADWWAFSWRRIRLADYAPPEPPARVLPPAQVRAGIAGAGGADSATWLGHAAFLLRLGGRTVLTDPFLSERASPFAGYGPRRYAAAPLPPEELPPADLLLLSHNHYDHLDLAALARLRDPDRTTVVTPLGVSRYLKDLRFAQVLEVDWGQTVLAGGLRVTGLPAIHFSKRTLFDRNRTLWCGFRLDTEAGAGRRVVFAGDTAYGPMFRETGRGLAGAPDLALVPIGAYAPEPMMRGAHCSPEDAVRIGRDLQAARLCAMHWGTIKMTDEDTREPPRRFRAAAAAAGYGEESAWLLDIGETRRL